jgi:histone deacetylase complex regulatory component SIN3
MGAESCVRSLQCILKSHRSSTGTEARPFATRLQQPRSDSKHKSSELQVSIALPYLDDVKTALLRTNHLYRFGFGYIIKAFSGTEMDAPGLAGFSDVIFVPRPSSFVSVLKTF